MELSKFIQGEVKRTARALLKIFFRRPFTSGYILRIIFFQWRLSKKRNKLEKKGVHVPPFIIMSITAKCNLKCKGCYSEAAIHLRAQENKKEMLAADYTRLFDEAGKIGVSLIMLAGGEPLLRRDVLTAASKHKDILFNVYTNAALLDEAYIDFFCKHRNLMLVLSIEGNQAETDERRGPGVYANIIDKIKQLNKRRLIFGVSITVTSLNIGTVTDISFIESLKRMNCKLVNLVEFEDMDSKNAGLKLSKTDRENLSASVEGYKAAYKNMLFSSNPSLEYQTGGCLAAGKGFFHINAFGDAEPCNFIPVSDTNMKDHSIVEALQSTLFKEILKSSLLKDDHEGECALLSKSEAFSGIVASLSEDAGGIGKAAEENGIHSLNI